MPALHSRSSAAAEPGSRSAGAMAPQPIAQTGDQRKAAPAPRAAGSADWQGMAPAAKLAFQDLGAGTSGTIDLGGDLATDYYPYTYARSVALRSQLACSALHESGGSDQRPGALPRRPCAACAQRAAAMPCSHLCAAVPSHWSGALPSRSPCASGTPGLRRPTPGSALLGWQDTRRALGDRRGAAGHGRAGARACTPTRGARRRRTTTASRSTWTPLPGRACTNALHLSTLTCSCAAWLPLALDVDTFAWARLHKCTPFFHTHLLLRCLVTSGARRGHLCLGAPAQTYSRAHRAPALLVHVWRDCSTRYKRTVHAGPGITPPGAPRVRMRVSAHKAAALARAGAPGLPARVCRRQPGRERAAVLAQLARRRQELPRRGCAAGLLLQPLRAASRRIRPVTGPWTHGGAACAQRVANLALMGRASDVPHSRSS